MKRLSLLFAALLACPLPCSFGAESPAKVQLPPFSKVKLENGLTLLLMEQHELPLTSFRWYLPGAGSLSDPPRKEGLAMITSQLLRKGTAGRNAATLAEDIDFVGGSLEITATTEFALGEAEFVKKDLDTALDLLSETLQRPIFPPEELDKMVQQEIDGIKQAKELPGQVLPLYFRGFLFSGHPYGRSEGGTESSLAAITREDVLTFYEHYYGPDHLVLAVVGDFTEADLTSKLKARFANWRPKSVSLPAVQPPIAAQGRKALLVEKPDATQAFFQIGNISLARTNADWIPAQVINTLFGGRFTSMLNSRLRIESGLTYHARTSFESRPLPGAFSMYFYSGNATSERAAKMALDVLRDLHSHGISQDQLKSAKAYIRGQFGPTLETNDQLAATLCDLHFYGLGPDYVNTYLERVEAVTLPEAKRVIDTYFPTDNLRVVIIGQKSVIDPIATSIGAEATSKSILDAGF